MAVQIVRPAGAGHETLAVLGASVLIVAAAASYIGWGGAEQDVVALPASQVDARVDLNPAEQGIYADLRVAHDEIRYTLDAGQPRPDAAGLAALGLPPFVQDPSSATRGGHVWSDVAADARQAYLGRSAEAAVAGSFLMLAPGPRAAMPSDAHGHGHGGSPAAGAEPGQAEIWLNRTSQATVPARLDPDSLVAAGWRQVMAQFDAGVTRQTRP